MLIVMKFGFDGATFAFNISSHAQENHPRVTLGLCTCVCIIPVGIHHGLHMPVHGLFWQPMSNLVG